MGVTIKNSRISVNDYMSDVSLGKVEGVSILNVSGVNTDIDSTTADLWPIGGVLIYNTSQETVDVVSTSTNDDILGTGARTLFLSGIDDAGEIVTDIIDMDGTTPVESNTEFTVLNFAFLFSSGTLLTNEGMITCTSSAGPQLGIAAGTGISQHGFFRMPIGKRAIIHSLELNGSKNSGGTPPVITFKVYARFSPTAPWIAILERILDSSVQDSITVPQAVSGVISAGADIRFEAVSDQVNTVAAIRILGTIYPE